MRIRRCDRASQLSYDVLDGFPWATAVVKETLRMWPTVTPQLGLQRCVATYEVVLGVRVRVMSRA